MNEARERARTQSPKNIPISRKEQGPRRHDSRTDHRAAEGGIAGVGFVRPRQWSRGQSPRRHHLSQLLLGFRTRRIQAGRLVNSILVHSPSSADSTSRPSLPFSFPCHSLPSSPLPSSLPPPLSLALSLSRSLSLSLSPSLPPSLPLSLPLAFAHPFSYSRFTCHLSPPTRTFLDFFSR